MEAGAVLCHRGRVLVPAVMNEAWRIFCRPGTKFLEFYECRGTSLIGAANLSPVTMLVAGTGAVAVSALLICLGSRKKLQKMWQIKWPLLSVLCGR